MKGGAIQEPWVSGCEPSELAGHNPPPSAPEHHLTHTELRQERSAGSGLIEGGSGEGRGVRWAEKEKNIL